MIDPVKIYRKLLKIYPAGFREEYEGPMTRQFRDEQRDTTNWRERSQLWIRALWDVAITAPRESYREICQDLRFAMRVYGRRPLSAALAVTALALSIGVTTGVFSVVNALLLRSLPFSDPGRLVELWLSPFGPLNGRVAFDSWREHSSYLESTAAFSTSEMNLNQGRDALRVKVSETSSNFFSLLGTKIILGRNFAPDEEMPGKTQVAVLSHSLWLQAYGGDPAVLGSTLNLDGAPLTVIGVAENDFDYPGKTSIWTPTIFDFETIPKHGAFIPETIGRLKPGITLAQARQHFRTEAQAADPQSFRGNIESQPALVGLKQQITAKVRQSVLILAVVVLFALLTACANVAQLLLSRTTERREELALRTALGASRSRLVQQLMTEATALTLSGALLGMAVAYGVARLAATVMPAALATQSYTLLDWRVLCFATLLAIGVGVAFGVLPAWLLGRIQSAGEFTRVQASGAEPATRRWRSALIGLQSALTLMLIASSLIVGRAFLRLLNSDLGFQPSNVITLNVSMQGSAYPPGAAQWRYYSSVLDRLRSIPGVISVGAVHYLPLAANVYMASGIKLDSGQQVPTVVLNGVMPGFFRTMGTKLEAGRDFSMNETNSGEPAVIVNRAFVRQAGLTGGIVGRKIIAEWTTRPYVIAGVVDTVRLSGPEYDGTTQIYWPVQEEPGPNLTFVAKVSGNADKYVSLCRAAVAGIDRSVTVYEAETLDQRLQATLARPRFYTTAILFLGLLSLLLAVIGMYGSSSYAVEQRRQEIGVRMALGALPGEVRAMVLRQGLAPMLIGVLGGVGGALWAGKILQHLITGVQALNLSMCFAAAAVLLASALLAAWCATGRIVSIDPIRCLRTE